MSDDEFIEPLVSPVVDTHCHMDVHYDDNHILPSVNDALANAAQVGVSVVMQVGCDVASSQWAVKTASEYSNVWATVALHPNAAAHDDNLHDSLATIAELARLDVVRGIGETGLDYFRTQEDQAAQQHESFRAHIDISKENNKPLIIHDRDAHDDVISTLLTYGAPDTVVFHCFSGDSDMAAICRDNGWYMSFSGVVTFKNAISLREALLVAPTELLLVETDSPFLTPTPFRGRPNASRLMPFTVRTMASTRGQSEQEMCEALFSNAARVFGPF